MTAPDDEALLGRFRQWLGEARAEADAAPPEAGGAGDRDVGLWRLAEEFTALRHEVKLQTKSARGLQEQAEALLPALGRAIEAFQGVAPREAQAAWAAAKPLAEALADLDEALDRGRGQLEAVRGRLVEGAAAELRAALEAAFARRSWFGRLRARPYHDELVATLARDGLGPRRELLDALIEGYGLIQARLRRAMAAEQVDRINTVGGPVDPDRMTVIEVVDAPGLPPGEVVDEVRRGYLWRGRVLRYAEVRAARGAAAGDPAPGQDES
jgi:molecular chaperone GrpE